MIQKKKISFEDIENKELRRLEDIEIKKQAKESAREKIKLGLKYNEIDFKNIQGEKLKELRKKEKIDNIKQSVKKGTIAFFKGLRNVNVASNIVKGKSVKLTDNSNYQNDKQRLKRFI